MSHSDSSVFARLGLFVARRRVWVLLGWLLAAGALNVMCSQLETIVREQSVSPLPADAPSIQTLSRMAAAFDENGAQTAVTIVMSDKAGLRPVQTGIYRMLLDRLRASPEAVMTVQDLLSSNDSRNSALSADGQAWYVMIGLRGAIGSPEAADSLREVKQITAETFAGSTVAAHVTGPVASIGDTFEAANTDLVRISLATAVLIAVILLLVYRSPFTAMLPLVVVGVSFVVARGVLSGLGMAGLPISQNSVSFLTAVLLGAGTDYSVFVISRYHQALRNGLPPALAVSAALSGIGNVLLASAATVAVAFAAMVFNHLEALSVSGPVCAIAVLVGFMAAVTLLPAVLVFAARRGIGFPRKDLTTRYWARVGIMVVRKPIPTLIASLVPLVLLASCAGLAQLSYNDRDNQPSTTESNLGFALLDEHFPKNLVVPQQLLIQSPHDLRSTNSLGDLEQMAQRISQLPGVRSVRGITRPAGTKLEAATLAGQAGKMGHGLDTSLQQADRGRGQLNQLTHGADQLADGLRQLKDALTAAAPMLAKLSTIADQYQVLMGKIGEAKPTVDQLTSFGASFDAGIEGFRKSADMVTPINDALRGTELCTSNPQCALVQTNLQALIDLRDNGFLDGMSAFRDSLVATTGATKLTDLVSALSTSVNQVGEGLKLTAAGGLTARMNQMTRGVGELSDGAAKLAEGVHIFVDKNLQMTEGLGQIAAALNTMNKEADSPVLSGFYLPQSTFDNADFKTMARFFVSADGKSVRYIIDMSADPFGKAGMDLARAVEVVARQSLPNTSLADASVASTGFASVYADLDTMHSKDFTQVFIVTSIIVGLILAALLRAFLAPLYLMATIILTYFAALGVGVLFFQVFMGEQLYWAVPTLTFVVLVAVGADYNMLLISRLRDESSGNVRVGVIRTVKHTGAVITSAGLIFAASMFGLMAGNLLMIAEIGFIVGCGLLLDTFVVRTLTVPAIATLLGKASWWPAKR